MKIASMVALSLALVMGMASVDADAKRLGGGKSLGMQRQMPARTAPDAPPAKPATPAQQAAPTTAPNAAAAPAAAPKRSWMGPLAGLAAGLGLAALMSHLGLGEAFGSFLLMALLAVAAIVAVRWFMARRQQPQPATAGMGAARSAQVAWPAATPAGSAASTGSADAVERMAEPSAPAEGAAPVVAPAPSPVTQAQPKAFVPAAFDSESFARTAKMIYIRLQTANDAGDLDDLRAFTTPEMFAELSMDLRDRPAGVRQQTEVVTIESEVLDVSDEASRQVVSVRLRGQVREEVGATPVAVDEVWHLTKPTDGSRSWAIAGIEQWQGVPLH
jgi:predicted lipid-binding transport protein (Tim44 family)